MCSEASRQQAHGFEQVSQALGQMEQMTQNNASSAEASATAGEALNTQARLSLATVEQLERLVGHSDLLKQWVSDNEDTREPVDPAAESLSRGLTQPARPEGYAFTSSTAATSRSAGAIW